MTEVRLRTGLDDSESLSVPLEPAEPLRNSAGVAYGPGTERWRSENAGHCTIGRGTVDSRPTWTDTIRRQAHAHAHPNAQFARAPMPRFAVFSHLIAKERSASNALTSRPATTRAESCGRAGHNRGAQNSVGQYIPS